MSQPIAATGLADPRTVATIVHTALVEDIGRGDLTSMVTIPAQTRARGVLLAKQDGVLSGGYVVAEFEDGWLADVPVAQVSTTTREVAA